ncbi:YidB family protein [Chenggangzhangella methanolivorans]|uniref:YidB family protein n=1 Tax=Chenggangzhangella methanolivorans TaxID=1437009 RepID=A0A9E6RC83_9HYPH|nr:YidB family protein [Chenggangzhangella methanolivorans]QZO02174.1 YidB family protein [Chenggangzhangella methanolivorans]
MGLFDSIKGSLGDTIAQAGAAALPGLLERVFPNGMQGVLDQLQSSGYGQQVKSWLGRGENEPITVEDLRSALDNEQVRAIAAKLGVPVDTALELLAGQLPQTVDQQSPEGELKPPAA